MRLFLLFCFFTIPVPYSIPGYSEVMNFGVLWNFLPATTNQRKVLYVSGYSRLYQSLPAPSVLRQAGWLAGWLLLLLEAEIFNIHPHL